MAEEVEAEDEGSLEGGWGEMGGFGGGGERWLREGGKGGLILTVEGRTDGLEGVWAGYGYRRILTISAAILVGRWDFLFKS